MPSWWEEGAMIVIDKAKRHIMGAKIKWDNETAPKPTRSGLEQLKRLLSQVPNGEQKSSPVYLLEQDCRKLLEWKDGGK